MFVNILFMLAFIRNLREVWIQIAKVVLGSLSLFLIVFCFMLFFSLLGYALFSHNLLDNSFADPFSSLYSVFGMFTEANYPNIEMAFFMKSRLAAVYFVVFMCIACFLLANLLLAVIFNNYSRILNQKISNNANLVMQFFTELFDQIVETDLILNPSGVTFDAAHKDQWSISRDTLQEALGGDEFIRKDGRLANMIW